MDGPLRGSICVEVLEDLASDLECALAGLELRPSRVLCCADDALTLGPR